MKMVPNKKPKQTEYKTIFNKTDAKNDLVRHKKCGLRETTQALKRKHKLFPLYRK